MKILSLNGSGRRGFKRWGFKVPEPLIILVMLLMLWPVAQGFVMRTNETVGYVDPNIWLLILLSLICFLVVMALSWWLLHRFWMALGLPGLGSMVLQFKTMELWKQLGFYFASYVLVLLAAVMCLMAIC